jgi:two-component system chemotaxis response regulator CheB
LIRHASSEASETLSEDGPPYHIIALAASAGGLNALSHVLGALPAGFPTPIVVVHHLDPRHRCLIAEILSRRTKLQV